MKRFLSLLLCSLMLAGCSNTATEIPANPQPPIETIPAETQAFTAPVYKSHFDSVTEVILSDDGITIDDNTKADAVFTSSDIIYYENRDTYESGNPYGEGTDADKHTSEDAAAHTVVNITAPGAYRVTGKMSAGQIRIDLGEDANEDPDAVVELILDNADITCTVAPAILFLNTYECDGDWSAETAKPDVDTSAAGANLILEGENTVNGSYVAKIFKDKEGEKKLWKQDGAIYSYMSMNVFGPGTLELNAANEGLDTELHLTINSGNITINSDNDGINTNEDGVSVTTINGGNLTIFAGLGTEGDGIDSNGYLVINGGNVISCAKPIADAGLDSDMGSFIHGGTVIAMGSSMDWAESDSGQVTMNLQFSTQQKAGSEIRITKEDGTKIFSFVPTGGTFRDFSGLILSDPAMKQGETYHVFIDGVQMAYTGTDVMRGPGGFGGPHKDFDPNNLPEGFDPEKMPEIPEGFDPSMMGNRDLRPDGGNMSPPDGFDGKFPEGMGPPELPDGGFGNRNNASAGEVHADFFMNDMVNFFSGVTAA